MGRGAMILSLFGALWLGLGLSAAGAPAIPLEALLAAVFILLLFVSGLSIAKGRALRRLYPAPSDDPYAVKIRKQFRKIGIFEAAGIVIAIALPQAIHRPYLITDWIAIVVGIHFLPLAPLFGAAVYYVTGIAIILWSVLAWALFAGSAIGILSGIGTGIILWVTAAYVLRLARRLAAAAAQGIKDAEPLPGRGSS